MWNLQIQKSMIKHKFFFLLLLIFSSCNLVFEDEKASPYNNFIFELNDDVSPVCVTIKAEGNWSWTRWVVDDTLVALSIDNITSEAFLFDPGSHEVRFEGWKGGLFEGYKSIQIPSPATKIQLRGFFFNQKKSFELYYEKELKVEFSYTVDQENLQKQEKIIKHLISDTIGFESPAFIYDDHISEKELSIDKYLIVEIIDLQEKKIIFHGIVNVFEAYSIDRLSYGEKLGVHNQMKDSQLTDLTLFVDWLP